MKNYQKITYLSSSLILICGLLGFTIMTNTDNEVLKKIITKFDKYHSTFYQQKMYVHTDRESYDSGDDIWFKTYLLTSHDNLPDTSLTNIYLELINPEQVIIQTKMVKNQKGFGFGDFHLTDTVPGGNYQLRAYTRRMQNFNVDYFFHKIIKINNEKRYYSSSDLYKKAKNAKKNSKKIDLQFFPEGGDLVDKLKTQIAFKAIDSYGKGIETEGIIVDKNGKQITIFKSNQLGMGEFTFTPEYKTKYYAIIGQNSKNEEKYVLPEIKKTGYCMNIDNSLTDNVKICIASNKTISSDINANSVILIAQSGGKIVYAFQSVFKDNKLDVLAPKSALPTGISQFTLFTGIGEPVCERLVFINHKDQLQIEASSDKTEYNQREKVTLSILSEDENGLPLSGNFSVSVYDSAYYWHHSFSGNIFSHLLLTSDLNGEIESPEYYFQNSNQKVLKDLDLLMMTQGWRKFIWKEILNEKYPKLLFPDERLISISGKISWMFFDIAMKNVPVSLTILKEYNDVYKQFTDKKGLYHFKNLDYFDTLDVLIEARNSSGGKSIVINTFDPIVPEIKFNPIIFDDQILFNLKGKSVFAEIMNERHRKKNLEKDKDTVYNKLHSSADHVVYFDDKAAMSNNTVLEYLSGRVPGLTVHGNNVQIRGQNSYYGSTQPLFLIDGTPVDASAVSNMSVTDVYKVEVLKSGSNTAIYGIQGKNGVIAVYTKRGFNIKWGELRLKLLGYCKAREFYTPKYYDEIQKNREQDIRKTVFWKPIVMTDRKGNASLEFFTPDNKSKFIVIVEGISNFGKIGRTTYSFNVK